MQSKFSVRAAAAPSHLNKFYINIWRHINFGMDVRIALFAAAAPTALCVSCAYKYLYFIRKCLNARAQ
jgi:hypothetical protein